MSIKIDIDHLYFKYEDRTILENITLGIQPGSFVSIIGPNGSGKSTLLKNISAVLKPNAGVIQLGEQDLEKITSKELAQQMAVVPQETNVEFRFRVLDIVLMGRSPHLGRFQTESMEDIKIVEKSMRLTGTWDLRDRFVNELSGGERQRVIIARALAQEPKALLLDEPTSYLDIYHQMEILELLGKLKWVDGLTIVAVLHDINLAARYSSQMVLLKDGQVIEAGDPKKVITQENLRITYGIDARIDAHPVAGTPYIIPLSRIDE